MVSLMKYLHNNEGFSIIFDLFCKLFRMGVPWMNEKHSDNFYLCCVRSFSMVLSASRK